MSPKLKPSPEQQPPESQSTHQNKGRAKANKRLPKLDSITKNTQTPNSNTFVYVGLDEPRDVCSFRGNKKLFDAFKRQLRVDSLSVCHVFEPVMLAYLTKHVYVRDTNCGVPPLVIEQFNVARVLKRFRRVGVELSSVEVGEESSKDLKKVERSKRPVKFVNWTELSDEEVVKRYVFAKRRYDVVGVNMGAFELKRRKLYERARDEMKKINAHEATRKS